MCVEMWSVFIIFSNMLILTVSNWLFVSSVILNIGMKTVNCKHGAVSAASDMCVKLQHDSVLLVPHMNNSYQKPHFHKKSKESQMKTIHEIQFNLRGLMENNMDNKRHKIIHNELWKNRTNFDHMHSKPSDKAEMISTSHFNQGKGFAKNLQVKKRKPTLGQVHYKARSRQLLSHNVELMPHTNSAEHVKMSLPTNNPETPHGSIQTTSGLALNTERDRKLIAEDQRRYYSTNIEGEGNKKSNVKSLSKTKRDVHNRHFERHDHSNVRELNHASDIACEGDKMLNEVQNKSVTGSLLKIIIQTPTANRKNSESPRLLLSVGKYGSKKTTPHIKELSDNYKRHILHENTESNKSFGLLSPIDVLTEALNDIRSNKLNLSESTRRIDDFLYRTKKLGRFGINKRFIPRKLVTKNYSGNVIKELDNFGSHSKESKKRRGSGFHGAHDFYRKKSKGVNKNMRSLCRRHRDMSKRNSFGLLYERMEVICNSVPELYTNQMVFTASPSQLPLNSSSNPRNIEDNVVDGKDPSSNCIPCEDYCEECNNMEPLISGKEGSQKASEFPFDLRSHNVQTIKHSTCECCEQCKDDEFEEPVSMQEFHDRKDMHDCDCGMGDRVKPRRGHDNHMIKHKKGNRIIYKDANIIDENESHSLPKNILRELPDLFKDAKSSAAGAHETDKVLSPSNSRSNDSSLLDADFGHEPTTSPANANKARDLEMFLDLLDDESMKEFNRQATAQWNYETNITEETRRQAIDASLELGHFQKKMWRTVKDFDVQDIENPVMQRRLSSFYTLGIAALSDNKLQELNSLVNDMEAIYSTAALCNFTNQTQCNLRVDTNLKQVLSSSNDPDELLYLWVAWRNATGYKMKDHYERYVKLMNEAATLNNFTDAVDLWLLPYEDANIQDKLRKLWGALRPLYLQLHAHVRRKLRERYGEEMVGLKDPIPAHLLGDLWGQTWTNTYSLTMPFPEKLFPPVNARMEREGYTPMKMFKEAEQFFKSVNLSGMPPEFWMRSIIERPTNVPEMVCHASAWDMHDGRDFRIKMCTDVSLEDLMIVHHEMGHVQYFLQYKDQPFVFREGANPGFHEAIGDVIALSVATLSHLNQLGFIKSSEMGDDETDLNFLFIMALHKVAFLPYGYLVDKWRWDVFQGLVGPGEYNTHWWKLKEEYQGIRAPVTRTNKEFDPGAKYHVAAGVPFIRYFISSVVQFQFHRALCVTARKFDPEDISKQPLHQCDIYGNTEAGNLLAKMLRLGSSKPWPEALEVLTGDREMDANALLDYFAPLQRWLEKDNQRYGEYIGWKSSHSKRKQRMKNLLKHN